MHPERHMEGVLSTSGKNSEQALGRILKASEKVSEFIDNIYKVLKKDSFVTGRQCVYNDDWKERYSKYIIQKGHEYHGK